MLEEGRVIERGTHEELMAAGGRYWSLLRRQQLEDALDEGDGGASVLADPGTDSTIPS